MTVIDFLFITLSPEAAKWSDQLNRAQQWLKPVAGPWTEAEWVPGLTGLQLALAAAALLVTAAAWWLVGRLGRMPAPPPAKAADGGTTAADVSLLRHILRAARAPLRLLIIVLGVYCALGISLFRIHQGSIEAIALLDWTRTAGLVGAGFWFLYRLINVAEYELGRWAARTPRQWDNVLVAVLIRALRLIVPVLGVLVIAPTLDLPAGLHALVQKGASLVLIAFIGGALCELILTGKRAVLAEYRIDTKDNLATRKIQTQVGILARIGIAVVVTITLACMLTAFAPVRTLGHSILASAGVAGIVLGIAAQRTLGSFFAGIQLAFTQPIRLDDVVVVEGQWGRVEEIALTYVVVAIWDKRRLVLPIAYFIEKPFENWTRVTSAILGTVMLYLDHTAPIAAMRQELDRILENNSRWDGAVKVLQVTDAKEHTIEVRVLASSVDSGTSFDLRCEIRERLIDFLQRNYPTALPRTRASLISSEHVGTDATPTAPSAVRPIAPAS